MTSLPQAAGALIEDLVEQFGSTASTGESDRITSIEESGEDDRSGVDRARALQRALYNAGFGWLSGPPEHGGQGLSPALEALFDLELIERGLPSRAPLFVGLHILAPALLHHGHGDLCDQILRGLLTGDLVGCQLFSEPGAGSDLAAVSTKAVRHGDAWLISGQKVWTSWAHVADIGLALVRSDTTAGKHAGLSMFLIDMTATGVTVRPLRQATGGTAFNEVFLDEVRVPDSHRVGEEGAGWAVAGTALSSERGSMASGEGPLSQVVRSRFRSVLQREIASDPDARPDAADEAARAVTAVVAALASFDRQPDDWEGNLGRVAPSIQKMLMVQAVDAIATASETALGTRAHLDNGEPDTFSWSEFSLGAPGLHLAGGTDEIQRILIGQLGLGFPRSPRARA